MTIRDLLRNALRMRPDRIVIGEVRGAEALDLLTALNTGHDGALSTVHANSPADALRRLETLALMAGVGLPHAAVAEQVRRGIDLVVHLRRDADGSRRVSEIAEVVRRGVTRCAPAAAAVIAPRCCRPAGAAAGCWRWRRARRCRRARRRRAGSAWRSSRCGGPARGLRALDPGAAPAAAARRRRRDRSAAGSWPGAALALPLASPGPAAVAWAISSRRRRYRPRGRALAAGGGDGDRRLAQRRPLAARLAGGGGRLARRPGASELSRLAGELELGAGTPRRWPAGGEAAQQAGQVAAGQALAEQRRGEGVDPRRAHPPPPAQRPPPRSPRRGRARRRAGPARPPAGRRARRPRPAARPAASGRR